MAWAALAGVALGLVLAGYAVIRANRTERARIDAARALLPYVPQELRRGLSYRTPSPGFVSFGTAILIGGFAAGTIAAPAFVVGPIVALALRGHVPRSAQEDRLAILAAAHQQGVRGAELEQVEARLNLLYGPLRDPR